MEDKLREYSDLALSLAQSAADRVSEYVCPGTVTAISRSVHLARLHAAWAGCDQCPCRHDTEGLAHQSITSTERIRHNRSQGIERTEFGIRGPYLNRIDRRIIGGLAQIFCQSLVTAANNSRSTPTARPHLSFQKNADDTTPIRIQTPTVLIGFDGRSSSPDIMAGVVSAVREFGLHVVDTGRSTASSLLEAVRTLPETIGAFLVTGAGYPTSFTGLDVFDRFGESIPVAWKEYGIYLQAVSDQGPVSEEHFEHHSPEIDAILSAKRTKVTPGTSDPAWVTRVLCLPEDQVTPHDSSAKPPFSSGFRPGFRSLRIARSSGQHSVVEFEPEYRKWLLRWYPEMTRHRIVVETADPIVADRMNWLASQRNLEVVINNQSSERPLGSLVIRIAEDDTRFELYSSSGLRILPDELAERINRSSALRSMHLTAHADAASGRFWITDTGRPNAGEPTEDIRDSLAILGLWLTATPLPR